MSPFLTVKIIQIQIVKTCKPINDFFILLHANKLAKLMKLNSNCHSKAANKTINIYSTICNKSELKQHGCNCFEKGSKAA